MIRYLKGNARNLGKHTNAKVYANGKLNKDIEIYKNYFQFNKLSNEYSIRKDFTASDFAEILGRVERHNRSYNAND